MKVYAIYDRCADVWSPIHEAKNDNVALRGLQSMTSKMAPGIADDYEIYRVGEWDETTGALNILPRTKVVPQLKEEVVE